jgi:hypothetical protein
MMTGGDVVVILHPRDVVPTTYAEVVSISNDIVIFAAEGEEAPKIAGDSGNAFNVAALSSLYLRGIEVSSSDAAGIASSGDIWIDECIIDGNDEVGVAINGGTATIRRSQIVNNTGGGIVVDGGGMLMLENSFVGGGNNNNVSAIHVVSGTVDMTCSTVGSGFGTSSALLCDGDQNVTVRNSLLVSASDDDELQCPSASVTSSALEMANGDNLLLGSMSSAWFTDYDNGDFHIAQAQPGLEAAATWQTGDPATDIDGDLRPTTDGPDFAGADVIP